MTQHATAAQVSTIAATDTPETTGVVDTWALGESVYARTAAGLVQLTAKGATPLLPRDLRVERRTSLVRVDDRWRPAGREDAVYGIVVSDDAGNTAAVNASLRDLGDKPERSEWQHASGIAEAAAPKRLGTIADAIRAAGENAADVVRDCAYSSTGFCDADGGTVFLSGEGAALTAAGADPGQHTVFPAGLAGQLDAMRYGFPAVDDVDPVEAFAALWDVYRLVPDHPAAVTALLGFDAWTPVASHPDFGALPLLIHGPTGNGKTTLAGVAVLQPFTLGQHGISVRSTVPLRERGTTDFSAELILDRLAGFPALCDDLFIANADTRTRAKRWETLSKLSAAAHEVSPRTRARWDAARGHGVQGLRPRAGLLFTGEVLDAPEQHESTLSRVLAVELPDGAVDEGDVRDLVQTPERARLTGAALALHVRRLCRPEVRSRLLELAGQRMATFRELRVGHPGLAKVYGRAHAGYRVLLETGCEHGAFTADDVERLDAEAGVELRQLAETQSRLMGTWTGRSAGTDPAKLARRAVRGALAEGLAYVSDADRGADGSAPLPPTGAPDGPHPLGWTFRPGGVSLGDWQPRGREVGAYVHFDVSPAGRGGRPPWREHVVFVPDWHTLHDLAERWAERRGLSLQGVNQLRDTLERAGALKYASGTDVWGGRRRGVRLDLDWLLTSDDEPGPEDADVDAPEPPPAGEGPAGDEPGGIRPPKWPGTGGSALVDRQDDVSGHELPREEAAPAAELPGASGDSPADSWPAALRQRYVAQEHSRSRELGHTPGCPYCGARAEAVDRHGIRWCRRCLAGDVAAPPPPARPVRRPETPPEPLAPPAQASATARRPGGRRARLVRPVSLAVLDGGGLHLPDRTLEVGAGGVGVVLDLAAGHGVTDVHVHPAAHGALDMPEDPARVSELAWWTPDPAGGWERQDHLSGEAAAVFTRDGQEVYVGAAGYLSHLRSGAAAGALEDPATLLATLQRYSAATGGHRLRHTPARSGIELLRDVHHGGRRALPDRGQLPAELEDPRLAQDLVWLRNLEPAELALGDRGHVHVFDAVVCYLGACSSLDLPLGGWEHRGAEAFDGAAGVWLVDPPAGDSRLPDVADPQAKGLAGPRWVTTPKLTRLLELHGEVPVLDAWVAAERGRWLTPWYDVLRPAVLELGADATAAGRAARSLVKATATNAIGKLGEERQRGKPLFRPEWRAFVMDTAAARAHRAAERMTVRPWGVKTDALIVVSDQADPVAAAELAGVELDPGRLGKFKLEGSAPLPVVLAALAAMRAGARPKKRLEAITDAIRDQAGG